MFGVEDEFKELKTALQTLDCDMAFVKSWQKSYDKTRKLLPGVIGRYSAARSAAVQAESILERLEQSMKDKDTAVWSREQLREFQMHIRELKKLQNAFDHEFLVSKEDKELHLTYQTVIKLGAKLGEEMQQRIILQSEIENALSLLKENLEKEIPDYFQLGFFYLHDTDESLVDLPPSGRLERLRQNFETEFYAPMTKLLTDAIQKADTLKDTLETEQGKSRRADRISEELRVLWNKEGENVPPQERADRLVRQLCAQAVQAAERK